MFHARAAVREARRRYGVEAKHLPFCLRAASPPEAVGPAARAAARERLGVAPDTVLVVTLGFTHETKAPEDVLWALEVLRAWGVPARLLYVGAAMMDFTPLRAPRGRAGPRGARGFRRRLRQRGVITATPCSRPTWRSSCAPSAPAA